MTIWLAGTSELAHGLHYGVLVVGLLGMLAMLGPRWIGEPAHGPRDEHERRVAALHTQIAAGSLGTATQAPTTPVAVAQDPTAALIPFAVVSSAAAAGVHSAVAPAHFGELLLFGLFFVGSGVLQLAWSVLMVLHPSHGLLVAGVVLNAGVIILWAVTRTVGLPFGLLTSPEAVGTWDMLSVLWEAVVVVVGIRVLRRGRRAPLRPSTYDSWSTSARLWLFASVTLLGSLTLSGVGA